MEVVDFSDRIIVGNFLCRLARVASRFFKFKDNVSQGGKADLFGDILVKLDAVEKVAVACQARYVGLGVLGYLLYERVAFGMDCRVVERIFRSGDAEEACALLECFLAHAGHVEKLGARGEIAVLSTIFYDVCRERRAYAGDVGEKLLGGGVDVHTDGVDAAFNDIVERILEFCLIYGVLILSDTNRLRVYFYKFCKRVEKPTSDRHGSAHRHILVREFLTGNFRC